MSSPTPSADRPRSPRNRSRIVAILLYTAILPVAVASSLALFGRFHWVLDLLSHFRVQYLAWFSILALAAVLLRQRNPAIVACFFALANAVPAAHYLPPRAKDDPESRDLRVVTFNILETNPHLREAVDWILAQDADIVVVPEFSPRWIPEFKRLDESFPHNYRNPGYASFGLAIYSRWPLTNKKRHVFCSKKVPCLTATADFAGREIQVVAVHPMSPVSEIETAFRNEHLLNLSAHLKTLSGPVILAGDINSTVFSPTFQKTIGSVGLLDSARGYGYHPTYDGLHPAFGIQIDHILHTREFKTTAFRTGPKCGSDHRPVVADLKLE